MPATQALQQAGLKPIERTVLTMMRWDVTNAYATGQAALLVADGALPRSTGADLIYARMLEA